MQQKSNNRIHLLSFCTYYVSKYLVSVYIYLVSVYIYYFIKCKQILSFCLHLLSFCLHLPKCDCVKYILHVNLCYLKTFSLIVNVNRNRINVYINRVFVVLMYTITEFLRISFNLI